MTHEGYYFNPVIAGFLPDTAAACLDHYQVELLRPVEQSGGEYYLSAQDTERFLTMLPQQKAMDALPGGTDAERCSIQAVFGALGCRMEMAGDVLQVLLSPEGEFLPAEQVKQGILQKKGAQGDYFGTYWHTPMERYAPYRVYLPASYRPEGKNRLLMCLHGGGGSPDTPFHNSRDQVKDYAERDGYILIAPDGSTNNSTYGCAIPPNGMLGARSDAKDPANPENLSEAELRSVQMGELGLDQVLALARRDYAVDEANLYLMGNSMGGMGTLYYASRHPGLFRKISPQGAIPDMQFFDCSGLRQQPTFFVGGDMDSHGVQYLREGCRVLKEHDVPVIYREVSGGTHSLAWVDVLDEIFEFFK